MDAITPTTPNAAAAAPSATEDSFAARSNLNQEDFYKIMIAELTHQDPLNPLDNQQFLQQMSSLQSLELSARLNDGIASLVFQQSLGAASGLIGKEVTSAGASGEAISGRVDRVLVRGQELLLVLDDESVVPMKNVLQIAA